MSSLKRFLSLTLAVLMIAGMVTVASAKTFEDVKTTDGSLYEAVGLLSEFGIVAGKTATEFMPDKNVTREQMALFIARLASGLPTFFVKDAAERPDFADLTDATYYTAIQFCIDNGIVAGDSGVGGNFRPKATVNLQEACKMLCVALGYKLDNFNKYMTQAQELGLLVDFDLTKVAPKTALNRGQVAQLLYRALTADMFETKVSEKWEQIGNTSQVIKIPYTVHKTLAVDKFNCTEISGRVVATSRLSLNGFSKLPTSRVVVSPFEIQYSGINGLATFQINNTAEVNYAGVAEDLFGKQVTVLVKNFGQKTQKILPTVLVKSTETRDIGADRSLAEVAINVDADKLTVQGSDYLYGTVSGIDRDCLYYDMNRDGNYVPVGGTAAAVEGVLSAVIAGGFYTFDGIDDDGDGRYDVLIYKPMSLINVAAVTETKDSITIANDAVGAANTANRVWFSYSDLDIKAGDYIAAYYTSVEFKAYAIADKAVDILATVVFPSGTGNKFTGSDSKTYQLKNNGIVGAYGVSATGVTEGFVVADGATKYTILSVDGVVVSIIGPAASTAYPQKNYYVVEAIRDRSTDGYGNYLHQIRLRNNAGASTEVIVKKIDSIDVRYTNPAATPTDWAEQVAGGGLAAYSVKPGQIVVYNGDNNIITNATAGFVDTTRAAHKDAYITAAFDEIQKLTAGLYVLENGNAPLANTTFAFTSYSKVIIRYGVGTLANPYTYALYNADTFIPETLGSTLSNGSAILTDTEGVAKVVLLYAESSLATAPAGTLAGEPYIILRQNSVAALTRYYDAYNAYTGALEVISETGTTIPNERKRDTAGNDTGAIVRVVNKVIQGPWSNNAAIGTIALSDNYLTSKDTVNPAVTAAGNQIIPVASNTKMWKYDATNAVYVLTSTASDLNGLAGYTFAAGTTAINFAVAIGSPAATPAPTAAKYYVVTDATAGAMKILSLDDGITAITGCTGAAGIGMGDVVTVDAAKALTSVIDISTAPSGSTAVTGGTLEVGAIVKILDNQFVINNKAIDMTKGIYVANPVAGTYAKTTSAYLANAATGAKAYNVVLLDSTGNIIWASLTIV